MNERFHKIIQQQLFDDTPTEKRCTKCNKSQSMSMFYRCTAGKAGLSSWCKTCHMGKNHNYIIKGLQGQIMIDVTLSSWVYLFQMIRSDGQVLYKIGFTRKSVPKRLRQMYQNYPFDQVDFLHAHPGGTSALERMLKLLNEPFRQYSLMSGMATEWFDFPDHKEAVASFVEMRAYTHENAERVGKSN